MKKHTLLTLFFTLNFSLFTILCNAQTIWTIAGTSKPGYNGDGRKANTAQLNQAGGVAVDDSGNIYIADSQNNRIRKIYKKNGIIVTIAGTGDGGYVGDGGPAASAELTYPICVRVDSLRNIYFSDAGNGVIRKISAKDGKISTIAGNGLSDYAGDTGKATLASFNYPVGITLDKYLNLYIADQGNNVIRKIDAATGIITTVAGNHSRGFSGNGGPATSATLNSPTGVAVDRSGNIYIADFNNNEVRVVNANGIINAFAGTGKAGYNGGKGLADTTMLTNPAGVSTDVMGNIYIADAGDGVVRIVMAQTKNIYQLIGNANDGFAGDGGPYYNAQVSYPFDIVSDKNMNMYIADLGNNRIRKFNFSKN